MPGAAKASWRTLPKKLVLTDEPAWDNDYPREWWKYVNSYCEWLRDNHGAEYEVKEIAPWTKRLQHTFVIQVDGYNCGININDLGHLHGNAMELCHCMFFKQCLSRFEHYRKIHSWPTHAQSTLKDLNKCWRATEASSYFGNGKINARFFHHQFSSRPGLACRRKYALEILKKAFGKRVEDEPTRNIREYSRAIVESSVNVHIPGGYQNCWDRSPALIFALGGLLVQPTIFAIVGWERPRPGRHYLEVWDDLDNLISVVKDTLDNPDKYLHIRAAAREFWDQNCSPYETWRRVRWFVERSKTA
jgi:hypothetical protein